MRHLGMGRLVDWEKASGWRSTGVPLGSGPRDWRSEYGSISELTGTHANENLWLFSTIIMKKGDKMTRYGVAVFSAILCFFPASAFADDNPDHKKLSGTEIAEMENRVAIASGLIALGRKDSDAQMIAMGARILSQVKVDVVDPATVKEGAKAQFFNPRSLMDSLKSLDGGNEAAMSVKLSPDYTEPGKTICYWNYQCTSSYCGQFWDCG